MSAWLRGKRGGLAAFVVIAGLVAGGLGGVTVAALRLEQEQLAARARAEHYDKLRLALWRLDGLVAPVLAKEDGRPYSHYTAIFAPPVALQANGASWPAGSVLEPSPLLSADLPDWMRLHFQVDRETGWHSPQAPRADQLKRLQSSNAHPSLANVTPARRELLAELQKNLPVDILLTLAQTRSTRAPLEEVALVQRNERNEAAQQGANPANPVTLNNYALQPNAPPAQQQMVDPEFKNRTRQAPVVMQQFRGKGQRDENSVALDTVGSHAPEPGRESLPSGRAEPVAVALGPMVPLWVAEGNRQQLVFVRPVTVGPREACQGILLDAGRLEELLADEVKDLFPAACVRPVRDDELPAETERTMATLPFQLDPGSSAAGPTAAGWTPLRVGLALAWVAALVALSAVGLGGWSLIDLSERRIRFVSAVTHELRTPLTTLRLYLDMLATGMVSDEARKTEYLHTLNAEADRLNRLVGNVLDFSRLENQRPRLARTEVVLSDLLDQLRSTWEGRCTAAGKELVVEAVAGFDVKLFTDVQMVQQVVGNLIDNACKYSRDAADPHIWVRARPGGRGLILEVEDRGPGVPSRERQAIFRPFRRGKGTEVVAGGVGLGLALAQRWSSLLGGRLTLHAGPDEAGACFRLDLPLAAR